MLIDSSFDLCGKIFTFFVSRFDMHSSDNIQAKNPSCLNATTQLISSFLENCKVETLLNTSGIRKLRKAKPRPYSPSSSPCSFGRVNSFRSIANNPEPGFARDVRLRILAESPV
jgi:hypothetical protein